MKANFLIEFEDTDECDRFELWLRQYVDYQVTRLPDTSELYETDENFRKLCGGLKIAKQKYNDYINKTKLKQ